MTNLRILTGLLLFGAWGFCHAADAAPAKALEEILGSSGEWQVAPYQGATPELPCSPFTDYSNENAK